MSQPKEDRVTYLHGHKCYYGVSKAGQGIYFLYKTDKQFNFLNPPPCPKCKLEFIWDEETKSYIDPCLGRLPGVKNACCGHGKEQAYIQFNDKKIIRFKLKKIEN